VRCGVEPLEKRTMLVADNLYWDPNQAATAVSGTGTWDTTTVEWRLGSPTGSLSAWRDSYTAIFQSGSGTVTLGASVSVANISFISTDTTVVGPSGTALNITATNGQISVDGLSTATINSAINASSGMIKTNTGTLSLAGAVTGASAELNVSQGSLSVSGAQSWQSVEVGASGTLIVQESSAPFVVSGGITADGLIDHSGGAIQTPQLNVDSTGIFSDQSGSVSGISGTIAINNSGIFDSSTNQSLAGATGSFYNSGFYEAQNASGSGTTTLSLLFTQGNGTIDVTTGMLTIPAGITFINYTASIFEGSGTLSVTALDDDAATVTQYAGLTVSVSNSVNIGDQFGTGAQYNLAGGAFTTSELSIGCYSTASFIQTGGTLTAGQTQIGSSGQGFLTQTGGTSSFYDMYIAISGHGTLNLSAGTTTAYSIAAGRLGGLATVLLSGTASLTATAWEAVGDESGFGNFTQSGTSTNTTNSLGLGSPGGYGTYTLTGGTLVAPFQSIDAGVFTQTGGINTNWYFQGGDDSTGAMGSYNLTGGTFVNDIFFQVGIEGGAGVFTQSGGTSNVSGSLIEGITAASAIIAISGGSMEIAGDAYVGYSSNATFAQTGGIVSVTGDMIVSGDGWVQDAAGIGTYQLSGTSQLTTGRTFIGYSANGSFTQSAGTFKTSALIQNGPSGTTGIYNQSGGSVTNLSGGTVVRINVLTPSSGGASLVNEGTPYTLGLSATYGVGNNAIDSWGINWGDSSSSTVGGNANAAQHTYYISGQSYTINATAYSNGASFAATSQSVLVNDVPATIAPIASQNVSTGSSLSISTTFTDPGIGETHTTIVSWGDGTASSATVNNSTGTITATHTYLVHGEYTPEIQVTDSGGAVGILSFNVHVLYVPPSVAAVPPQTPLFSGDPITLDLNDYGPESPNVSSWLINWGDGSAPQTYTSGPSSTTVSDSVWTPTHVYSSVGTYNVSAIALVNGEGNYSTGTISLTISHPPGLEIDILAMNGSGGATVTSVGQVIPLQVWAVVSGEESIGNNSGLDMVTGSFISSMASAGSVHGDLSVYSLSNAFDASGAQYGTQQDLTSDGNLDVGSNDGSNAAGYFIARAGGIATGTTTGSSDKILIATLNYTVTSMPSGGETDINFFSRQVVGLGFAAVWQQDGQIENETTAALSPGTPFILNAGTQPVDPPATPAALPITVPPPGGNTPAAVPGATVALTGGGIFTIELNNSTQQYSFTQNGNVIDTVGDLAGFTFTGAGSSDSLNILSGDPMLLNDAGSDGTSLSVTVEPDAAISFYTTEHLSSLTILSGATATMLANGQSVLVTSALSLAGSVNAWTGKLDLNDNGLIVHLGNLSTIANLSTITNQLSDGYNHGLWNGNGILSSAAASDPDHLTALGSIVNQQPDGAPAYSTFDGQAVSNSDILVQYTYYGDTNLNGEVDGTDYSLIDTGYLNLTGWQNGDLNYDGAVDGDDYTPMDNAFNQQGSPIVNPGTGVLAAPRSLTASAFSATEIDLSWIDDASSPDALNDVIYESTNNAASFNPIGSVISAAAGSINSYQAFGLTAGDTYEFYIRANGAAPESLPSNTVTQSTYIQPMAIATTVSDQEIDLSWTGGDSLTGGFDVYRLDPGTSSYNLITTVGADVFSYPDTGLTEDSTYCYEVVGIPGVGQSVQIATSASVSATTLPAAPTDLQVSYNNAGSVTFNWTNNPTSTYALVDEMENDTWVNIGQVTLPTSTLTVTTQTFISTTSYQFEVKAYSPLGGFSLPEAAQSLTPEFPSTPTNLRVSDTEGFAYLVWSESTPDAQFDIQRSSDGTTWAPGNYATSSDDKYGDVNAAAGSTYYYRVQASVGGVSSAYSNIGFVDAGFVMPKIVSEASATPATVTGTTASLSVLGGLTNSDDSNLIYNWTWSYMPDETYDETSPLSVVFSDNNSHAANDTTVTFGSAGVYDFAVTISNGLANVESNVAVTVPQTLTNLTVTSSGSTVLPGESLGLSAVGYDQFGNVMEVLPSLTWTTLSGPGSINNFVYFAPSDIQQATVVVGASSGTVSSTGVLTVSALTTSQYSVRVDFDAGESNGGDYIPVIPLAGNLMVSGLGIVNTASPVDAVQQAVSGTVTVGEEDQYGDQLGNTETSSYPSGFTLESESHDTNSLSWSPSSFTYIGKLYLSIEEPNNQEATAVWDVTVTPVEKGDLVIDSLNISDDIPADLPPLSGPVHDAAQANEDDPTRSGKIVVVDDYDQLANNVPDFVDGVQSTVGSSSTANSEQTFVPLEIVVPSYVGLEYPGNSTMVQFDYDGSDPTHVTGPANSSGGYTLPSEGKLRIWDQNANSVRNGNSIVSGGDYITPGVEIPLSSLYPSDFYGVVPDHGTVFTVYVEAVKASVTLGDQEITAWLDPTGAGTAGDLGDAANLVEVGAVRLTAVQDSVPDYSAGDPLENVATNSDGQNPGAESYQGAVRLSDGTVQYTTSDIETNGYGLPWGTTRTWTNQLLIAPTGTPQGNGWSVADWPHLIQAGSTVIAVLGSNVVYFDVVGWNVLYGGNCEDYKSRYFSGDTLVETPDGSYSLVDSVGDTFVFNSFSVSDPLDLTQGMYKRGGLYSYTDANGVVAQVTQWDPLGNIETVVRGGDTFTYSYNSPQADPSAPLNKIETLNNLQAARVINQVSTVIAQVNYTYYGSGSPNGDQGDLQSSVVETLSPGGLTQTGGSYYRYIPSTGGGGGQLSYAVDGENYLLLLAVVGGNNGALADATINQMNQFSTLALTYNGQGRVATQTIQGAGNSGTSSSGQPASNALGVYSYQYNTLSNSDGQPYGINDWKYRTTVTRPDQNIEIVYLNNAGEVMLTDLTTSQTQTSPTYVTFYTFDSSGALTMVAFPSATTPVEAGSISTSFDASPDLMGSYGNGTYDDVSPNTGLVDYFDYVDLPEYSGNGPYAKMVEYLQQTAFRNDAGAGVFLQSYFTYQMFQPVTWFSQFLLTYVVTSVTTFSNATSFSPTGAEGERTTTYYNNYGQGSFGYLDNMSTGSGSATHLESVYVALPATADVENGGSSGQLSSQTFDAYGNPNMSVDADGTTASDTYDPATGAMVVSAGGAGDTTTTQVDPYGRPTQITDPNDKVTNISYTDGVTTSTVRTAPAAGPITVVLTNWAKGYIETYTVPFGSAAGAGAVLSLSVAYLNTAGQTVATRQYYQLNGITESALTAGDPPTTGYYSTSDGYDSMGRLSQTTDTLGDVTTTVYTPLGWVSMVSLNGTLITENQYDNGGSGDGNLTQTTNFVDGNTPDNRVTMNYYDWRDRLVATSNGVTLTDSTLDNLGEITSTKIYNATKVSVSDTNGVVQITPNGGSDTGQRAQTDYSIDARGQVYQAAQDWVDQTSGAVNTSKQLITKYYYDDEGAVTETIAPSGLVTYNQYDGDGRVTLSETGGGATGTDGDPTGGGPPLLLVSKTATTYDKDGDPTLVVTTDYGTGDVSIKTDTVANWYNSVDQLVATADSGTAIPPLTQPTSSNSTALVSTYTYDADGFLQDNTDPEGVVTHRINDPLGRVVTETDNYSGNGTNYTTSSNRVTAYAYNPIGEQTDVSVNNVTGTGTPTPEVAETTTYHYGNNGTNTPLDQSLLTQVTYPDGSTSLYTYNNVGQIATMTDRAGSKHVYTYDAEGRQTLDAVKTFGPNVDTRVKAIGTQYDALGNVLAITSYNTTTGPAVTNQINVLNQVEHAYDGFGQLVADYENPNGAVSYTQGGAPINSPSVQYVYEQSGDHSRLIGEVYPGGTRAIVYGYASSPIDDEISRVDSTSDGTANTTNGSLAVVAATPLESDSYLGATIVGRNLPQISVTETTSLDIFNRVESLEWGQARPNNVNLDDYDYVYNPNGSIAVRSDDGGDNYISTDPAKIQGFDYNGLGNLTSSLSNGIVTDYTVDSMGNRLNSNSYNSGNEQADQNYNGGSTVYLPVGNNNSVTVTYDAWGRITQIDKSSTTGLIFKTTTVIEVIYYQYDASGREDKETDTLLPAGFDGPLGTTTTTVTIDDSANNPIETDITEAYPGGNSTSWKVQYVWSGADGRLILRDTVGGQRLYDLTDAQGDVTALVGFAQLSGQSSASWQVVERYAYNADGVPTAYTVNWSPISTSSSTTIGAYNWNILYHGQQWIGLYNNYGLYASMIGENWYDPQQARTLVPQTLVPDQNPYNAHVTIFGSEWLGNQAGNIASVAELGIAATLTIATGGVAGLFLGGFVGGALGGFGSGYAAGESGSQLALDAGVGAFAGVAGAAVGGAVAGGFCPSAIEGWLASGIAGGAVGGAIEGGYSAGQAGGDVLAGAAYGALEGAAAGAVGAAVGYGAFSELGLLDGLSCFIAGTQVAFGIQSHNDLASRLSSASGSIAVATDVYLTVSIEKLAEGQKVLARGENDPFGPLRECVVDKVFCRITFNLRILTLRMSDGREQTIYTTDEHPAYESEAQWTPAGKLQVGDQLLEASGGMAMVVATRYESHPHGIEVFNLRVADAHTYLVRAEVFDGEPIWVHNSYKISSDEAENITTPYGPAIQSSISEAATALEQVQNGATVYKGGVLGRSETAGHNFFPWRIR
jgi:hypothetical protein